METIPEGYEGDDAVCVYRTSEGQYKIEHFSDYQTNIEKFVKNGETHKEKGNLPVGEFIGINPKGTVLVIKHIGRLKNPQRKILNGRLNSREIFRREEQK